ncbi:uncharacterized protein LOC131064446 [Cryptomeria japonica]|uniref:uncharacterized protein LOC131064446 n=1 Tax=Cryptomeria japonica TaxID=3369 RepID=UPI0027DA6936|nr:uncharacterized protein LOC131064446 [Cryptomeria japonica]
MLLSEFDLKFISQKSIKGQVITDQLVDAPSSKSFPTLDLFPDEDVLIIDQDPIWDMYFDGLRCQTGSGAGVIFVSPEGKPVPLSFCLEFHCTNNIAEYEALIVGFRAAIAMGVKHIHIHGDSKLIVNQVTGANCVKQLKLPQYKDLVLTILKQFAAYMIDSISRRENYHADAMASVASLVGPDFGQDEYYFVTRSFPEDASKSSRVRIRKLATRYILLSDVLYWRSYNGLLLGCLTKAEIPVALQEAHSGSGGGHFGGKSLAHKLIHMGYYWHTMEQDSFAFVKKCPQYYFTKWVEAVSLRSITADMICGFIMDNIISRFGIPVTLISDNGTSFKNKEVKQFLEKFCIQHRFSTPYYPRPTIKRKHLTKPSSRSYARLSLSMLELLDEHRLKALQHLQAYQKSQSRQYNQSVLPRTFQIGDLVLYENQRNVNTPPDQCGKFSPNWLGPYIVTSVYGSGAYGLSSMDGTPLKEPINAAHLRRYYA